MRDPELDREHDGVALYNLLHYDDVLRGVRLSNYKPHTFTPAQRAAVDAYRLRQLS